MDPLQTQKKSGGSRSRSCRKSSSATAANNYRFINMAEARREVALALQHHRSSSSAGHHHHAAAAAAPPSGGGSSNYPSTSYCYSAMDTLPIPGPVWSTTSPAVLAQPPPPPPVLAWPESQHQPPLGLDYYCGGSDYYDPALWCTNYNNDCISAAAAANGDIPDWWPSSVDGGGVVDVSDEASKYFDQCYSVGDCSPPGISPVTDGRLWIQEKPDI
ncbi:unnamed protein product [Linum trigynum]